MTVAGVERSTSQPMRFLPALDPTTAPLDGRTSAELAAFARTLADALAFWHGENRLAANKPWPKFLPDLDARTLAEAELEAALSPQKALFLAFLKLYGKAQRELNAITGRHLEFYYREVLGLSPRGAQPDHAHLVLALKKTAREILIPRGTLFSTKSGLVYASDFEVVVNRAEVVHRRVLARDPATGRLRYAAEAASADGLGEPLPPENPAWHPYGHGHALPQASLGFALSAPVLLMREGTRLVTIFLTLSGMSAAPAEETLRSSVSGYISGEKEWMAVGAPTSATGRQVAAGVVELQLTFTIDAGLGPVTAYDPTVLEGGFDTLAPVLKVLLLDDAPDELVATLASAEVQSVRIEVAVSGMKNLVLENDYGRLDPSKAFMPFGPAPRRGASFYINAEEALAKDITGVKLHLEWNPPPSPFEVHYSGYTDASGAAITTSAYFTADLEILRKGKFEPLRTSARLFEQDPAAMRTIDSTKEEAPVLTSGGVRYSEFAANIARAVKGAPVQLPFSTVSMSGALGTLGVAPVIAFRAPLLLPAKIAATRLRPGTREGFLRLRLNKDFLHDRYPKLFAEKVTAEQPPPNPPYTPELASFTLDYTAQSAAVHPNSADAGAFAARELRLFHLTPFGQREEHRYIKDQVRAKSRAVTLFPDAETTGELYLGLNHLEARGSVSLLFQVLEGSANPLATRPVLEWSVLASNHWRPLEPEEILAETTNGFLVSGIVRLQLPPETSTSNTLLEPGLVWIRAAARGDITGVCRVLAVHPQAVAVTLTNAGDAAHLETSLPSGQISLAPPALRGLKEVSQPYSSFGGAAPENTRSFHTRTSERLRHRARAVTPWDFERLVLDRFPKLYRAQCLPHTSRHLQTVPGCVTLVLLADTRGKNRVQADPLRPFTDLATLAEVEEFLASLHTPFAEAAAINPVFEPVRFGFKVRFRPGKPFATYRPILEEELKRHLSPWAFDESQLPDFGGTVLRSAVLAFIESRDYVDFIADLQMFPAAAHGDAAAIHEVHPSTPAAIITSSDGHAIEPLEPERSHA